MTPAEHRILGLLVVLTSFLGGLIWLTC